MELQKLFSAAKIANYNSEEMNAYEESLKTLRDNFATAEFVEKSLAEAAAKAQEAETKSKDAEAKALEAAKKAIRIAKSMKEDGMDTQLIMKYTDLSQGEIENL